MPHMSVIVDELPLSFACDGQTLVGILHLPQRAPSVGVIILVGGPQYRVGSHRQFLLLARSLALRGAAVLRFDCRGMGDSEGEFPGFEYIEPDLAAAVNAMTGRVPSLRRLVLWGLCDATTAICMHAPRDPRIAGVVLVNPWVRTESGHARAQLKHYYLSRLMQRDFLRKVLSGKFDTIGSARALLRSIGDAWGLAARRSPSGNGRPANALAQHMASDLRRFGGKILLILSGQDLTAREFDDVTRNAREWRPIYADVRVTRRTFSEADHTFSCRAWRDQVADWTWEWTKELAH
jgi:exosortase A-associated hydrolase 1